MMRPHPFLFAVILTLFSGLEAASAPRHDRRVVCYVATWGIYFSGDGRFEINDINGAASYCTHIVLLFATLDDSSLEMGAGSAHRELIELGGISKALKLKETSPHLKIMVSLGGWNDGSVKYSRLVRDETARTKFVNSVERFLVQHKLDGIDINWQFPGDRGGATDDRDNYVSLIKELREVLDRKNLIVSVAVTAFPWRIALGTDGKRLSEHAHFLNVLSYEYHAKWDNVVGSTTPLNSDDDYSVNDTIHRYLNMGADPSKLNLGLSAYGTTFILAEPGLSNDNLMGARVTGGFHGAYNDVEGFLAYNELCLEMSDGGWTEIWDQRSMTPLARNGAKLASFDNAASYKAKIKLAMEKKLGGVIFYGLEKDDFKGSCASSKGPYPLMRAITDSLLKHTSLNYNDIMILLKHKNANYFWNGMKD